VCGETPTTTLPETTTTTVPDTTTTTLALRDCDVTFRLEDDVTAGSLQWVTAYGESGGSFVDTGENVECTSLTDQTISAINEDSEQQTLETGLISLAGIDGPINLTTCVWRGSGEPAPEDFVVSDIEAATVDLELLPDPQIGVHVDCDGGPPDTTSTTTTTSTTSTTIEGAVTSKVVFRLDSASAPLGALQLLVDYGSAPGEFSGEGAVVECVNKVPDALTARNDDDAGNELSLGYVSIDGFSAPLDLSECEFVGAVPVAGDFAVTIQDAAGIDSEPATASVSVVVTPVP
jgi:hypothetical protein